MKSNINIIFFVKNFFKKKFLKISCFANKKKKFGIENSFKDYLVSIFLNFAYSSPLFLTLRWMEDESKSFAKSLRFASFVKRNLGREIPPPYAATEVGIPHSTWHFSFFTFKNLFSIRLSNNRYSKKKKHEEENFLTLTVYSGVDNILNWKSKLVFIHVRNRFHISIFTRVRVFSWISLFSGCDHGLFIKCLLH